MNLISELPLWASKEVLRVVVEVPRGSALKLKYNPELELFEWSRPLSAGVCFPYDYGFIPQTLGGDDDALDAIVLAEVGSYPGVIVPARVLGALRMTQQREGQARKRNDRFIVVPVNEHRHAELNNVSELPARVRDELEAFFSASLMLTGKQVEFHGYADADEALGLITEAHAAFTAA